MIKHLRQLLLLCLFLSPLSLFANSEIFPATATAIDKINWKDGYFYINEKPTFLTSGEMHYARIPRELWRDRLWRAKQMGFNCIQMYVFWNAHEGRDGVWDFTDNLDLDAWLSLIQEMGMYAIVRVGPYSCAEWEHGGFPAWLTIKPGMTLRDSGELYSRYADRHLAKVYEIVKRHQIHKGGNVIMVQLENEHPIGWGTDPIPHLTHLYDQARAAGLDIPLFFSGLHHGAEPSGETPYAVGKSPWFTTEFWTGWIGKYGDMTPAMLQEKVRGTWKIIAFGGSGYDYYVVHGGTNLGYSGNDSMDATYDYSAPIGEAGQLRNLYYPARRAALFAQSFSSVLTTSKNAPDFAKASMPELRVTSRTSPNGAIVFVDHFLQKGKGKDVPQLPPDPAAYHVDPVNPAGAGILTTITVDQKGSYPTTGDKLIVQAEEPKTLLFNLPWTPNATLSSVITNVLFRQKIRATEYWVCYGQPGQSGEVNIERKAKSDLPAKVTFTYPKDSSVTEIPIDSGDHQKICLLVMNLEQTNRTWLCKETLFIGPDFVREDGTPEFTEKGGVATVYKASGKTQITCQNTSPAELPKLTGWSWRDAAKERQPDYPDSAWASSQVPQPMETYHDFQNRYAWYRTVLHSDKAVTVPLALTKQTGSFAAFLNGKPTDLKSLSLQAGENSLAVFLKTKYRPKLYNFTGSIGTGGAQGIWGDVSLSEPSRLEVLWKRTSWVNLPKGSKASDPNLDDSNWEKVDPSQSEQEIPKGSEPIWFRGVFNGSEALKQYILEFPHLTSIGVGTIFYLNGTPLNYRERDSLPYLELTNLIVPGANVVAFAAGARWCKEGKVDLAMKLRPKSPSTTWRFRGGLEDLEETPIIGRVTNWADFMAKPWNSQGEPEPGLPTLWMCHFDYHPTGRETIGIMTAGLKAGHVWLNGHNLGECPQAIPLYAPECWLKEGSNDLVVFDMTGAKPNQVKLQRYESWQAVR